MIVQEKETTILNIYSFPKYYYGSAETAGLTGSKNKEKVYIINLSPEMLRCRGTNVHNR